MRVARSFSGTLAAAGVIGMDSTHDISTTENSENTVVLVDDDPTLRSLFASTLQLRGISIVTAANGYEGLSVMRALRPKLVLLDVRMPGISGPEVCRKMREEEGLTETFVIFLSTQDDPRTLEAVNRAGADGYMCKPFDTEKLLAIIDRVLGRG